MLDGVLEFVCFVFFFGSFSIVLFLFANDKLKATISDYCHTQNRIVLSIVQFIGAAVVVCTANGFIG